jgi:RimJ/RimL family protein N-acetyltransferase
MRLRLRPLSMADLEPYSVLHGLPEVVRYLPWEPRDPAEARKTLERKIADAGAKQVAYAVIRDSDDAFLGELNLTVYDAANRNAEIGFLFRPEFHGHGYATEAARELLRIAFVEWDLHRLIGRCDARNDASARLMRRLGTRQEAHFRRNEFIKGEWTDELVFALLAEEWAAGCQSS